MAPSTRHGRRAKKAADELTMERIIVGEAVARDGLAPAVLQVMVCQFFAADILQREMDRHRWVERVRRPDSRVNYFPSPQAVLRVFFDET